MTTQLATAYSVCRGITRAEARNFYYAFLVLPRRKRDALSAVYAFMRHADDIADDLKLQPVEKHDRLGQWVVAMRHAVNGGSSDDPVLVALADACARYHIPAELLEELVAGTVHDSSQPTAAEPQAFFNTFDELYSYCYNVASVVGLVAIRVFGYSNASMAEPLAERCGIAFQLTNILRDVREDAAMGRVYLPAQDLAACGRSAAELAPERLHNGFDRSKFRAVLDLQAQRAREFYRAADQLLPLLDRDSRAAFWVLVRIYRRLLEKIEQRDYDVFSSKIRLTTTEKVKILSQGVYRRVFA